LKVNLFLFLFLATILKINPKILLGGMEYDKF
jgi:hypothetical protein